MRDLLSLAEITQEHASIVGGKALSLALLTHAGLPVPPGFCLTTHVHRRLRQHSLRSEPSLAADIHQACESLGDFPVAVRSSATAEDGVISSFAGQQETILGVRGEEEIVVAIERCWASLDSERALAYRRKQGVREEEAAMAVVVQRLVPAEVAGVLFTRDPLDNTGKRMLIEASWGLGESVVSGRVMPDRWQIDFASGEIVERKITTKAFERTSEGDREVPLERQAIACLSDALLRELAELARRIENYYGEPRDVEWALHQGQLWLLQARPITASGRAERQHAINDEIARLRKLAEPKGTVWSRFNLSEVLPAPTPMTWAIVSQRLMSGSGGLGLMARDLGYEPDPALDTQGIFDLVCGRPYCNLSREARNHDRAIPFEHPFARLKADPRLALYPAPTINALRLPWWQLPMFPLLVTWWSWRMWRGDLRRRRWIHKFAEPFREQIVPAFLTEIHEAAKTNLRSLDDTALKSRVDYLIQRTLIDFARESLKPTALASLSLANLQHELTEAIGPDHAPEVMRELVLGVHPDPETDLANAVRDLANGGMSREVFLHNFGHRCGEEMELSHPRWSEDPSALAHVRSSTAHAEIAPLELRLQKTVLHRPQREYLLKVVKPLHEYLGLRESAKHWMMLGYAELRRTLLELDRRYKLDDGIFYLLPEELPELLAGKEVSQRINERRKRRTLLLSIETPSVLYSDDLEAIGRPVVVNASELLEGVPLSAGVAEGRALVLEHPQEAPGDEYILVCPSTDPDWVPLFTRARGLVMETGGVLSHGAIVAREFGLPAVAGVPEVMRRLRTGMRLRVDGNTGQVAILPETEKSMPRGVRKVEMTAKMLQREKS
jgi:pyruvate,water dikinase